MKNIRTSFKIHRKKGFNGVTVNEYCRITAEFNKFIRDHILEGHEIKLPLKLGAISIIGRYKPLMLNDKGEIDSKNVNFKVTNELWKICPECKEKKQKIYYDNEHSNGVKYQFNWSRKDVIISNKMFYELSFTRSAKRTMADLIINKGKEYYVKPTKY
jgi:hypothetical protein